MVPSMCVPSIRSFIRFMQRRKVDLPQPDGPMKAVILFLAMLRFTSVRAWKSPYQKLKSETVMALCAASGALR